MTIKRLINGEEIYIELSAEEIAQAYDVHQNIIWKFELEDLIADYDDEDVKSLYGVTRDEYMSVIQQMVDRTRELVNEYGYNIRLAEERAVEEVLEDEFNV